MSSVFPSKAILESTRGATAVALSDRSLVDGLGDTDRQRGDTKGKDKYTFFGVSILKYFGGIECQKFQGQNGNNCVVEIINLNLILTKFHFLYGHL